MTLEATLLEASFLHERRMLPERYDERLGRMIWVSYCTICEWQLRDMSLKYHASAWRDHTNVIEDQEGEPT